MGACRSARHFASSLKTPVFDKTSGPHVPDMREKCSA